MATWSLRDNDGGPWVIKADTSAVMHIEAPNGAKFDLPDTILYALDGIRNVLNSQQHKIFRVAGDRINITSMPMTAKDVLEVYPRYDDEYGEDGHDFHLEVKTYDGAWEEISLAAVKEFGGVE